ncbi:MAG: thermonuclease family protein [Verrucomicrobia bacterium]|nr:thermonuclease family protein [Verrucomicrobiota bacterium]
MPITLMVYWFLLLCLPPSVHAADISNVKVLSCYDGDTCRVDLPRHLFADDIAYEFFGEDISVRIGSIHTPDIRGKCKQEKDLAIQARDLVLQTLAAAESVTLKEIKRGSPFRIVARVLADGQDVSTLLIQQKLAVPYGLGRKRKDWCE